MKLHLKIRIDGIRTCCIVQKHLQCLSCNVKRLYDHQKKKSFIFMKRCFDIPVILDNLRPGRNINQSLC